MIVESNFQRWVMEFGPRRLATELSRSGREVGVTRGTVYQWLNREREPRPARIRALVEIAQGRISFEDVHQHFAQHRGLLR
jgi:hypothetical protein